MCPAVPTVSATPRTLPSGSEPLAAGARRADGGGDHVDLVVGDRADVEQEASVAHDPDHGRLAEPERLEERLLHRAGVARELRQRERPAADTSDGLLHLAVD